MFTKILIANRGVVATRVARTVRRLGIHCAFVYSDADADLPYISGSDEVYPIGNAPARESYLNRDMLLGVIRKSGCDAVHPGWGFLSEDPEFARAVEEAGAQFIGPESSQIHRMGNKVEARRWMADAGIPVLPASGPVPEEASDLTAYVDSIGLPMLVKAAAGGGGIGMQRVDDSSTLIEVVTRTRQLSARTFGDGTVYLERYVPEARHIEFQMIGDGQGRVTSLFERDCSIQRRNQKIVEECPAPRVDAAICNRIGAQLAEVLAAWRYRNLGTVEMLMDQSGELFFLEMNTRLQVEHGVTEAVTGLDLVEVQLRLAAGETMADILPTTPEREGHAVELRIYAEDPVRFLPSSGVLTRFSCPTIPSVRVETPFVEGSRVTAHYDPLLALVIVHGASRIDALEKAKTALNHFHIEGIKTNIPFLRRLLEHRDYLNGMNSTTMAQRVVRASA